MSLKSKIAGTIHVPQFVRDYKVDDDYRKEILTMIYDILDTYYKGVVDEFFGDRTIAMLCRKIDRLSHELSQKAPADIFLQSWLWIGQTIESWIEFCLAYEKYESASNLKKILNAEYA